MQTWTDTTYYLDARERLQVVTHSDAVSVLLSGVLTNSGQGFSIHFKTAHLDALRQAVAHLEAVARQMEHTDHTPFQHDAACFACQREAALEDARQDADAERDSDPGVYQIATKEF